VATIQQFSEASSLPVLTIGEPNRILTSPEYADRVVERLLEYQLISLRMANRQFYRDFGWGEKGW
jgi:hypothetical protein